MPPRDAAPHRHRATVWLAWIVVALVVHGSLYPWRFAMPRSLAAAWGVMMHQPSLWTSLGDVVGNVVLFVPVGMLGWALTGAPLGPSAPSRQAGVAPFGAAGRGLHRWIGWRRTLIVLALGVAFAFVLQVAQLFIPQRSAALSDVVWNALGLLIGMGLVAGGSRIHPHWLDRTNVRAPLAMTLLWLMLQWWPMVPRLDWQQIKNALKPLLLTPRWSVHSAVEAALALLVLAAVMRPLRVRAALLLTLVVVGALGKLLMVHQALTLSRVVGWGAGLIGAWLLWRVPPRTAAWTIAAAALAWFTLDELRPFELADSLGEFHWLPFAALLQGSLVANTWALMWHLFWLGAVMLLADAQGARAAPVAMALSLLALGLELLQMLLPGRTADVTPLLLPWVWLLALPLLQPRGAAAGK